MHKGKLIIDGREFRIQDIYLEDGKVHFESIWTKTARKPKEELVTFVNYQMVGPDGVSVRTKNLDNPPAPVVIRRYSSVMYTLDFSF